MRASFLIHYALALGLLLVLPWTRIVVAFTFSPCSYYRSATITTRGGGGVSEPTILINPQHRRRRQALALATKVDATNDDQAAETAERHPTTKKDEAIVTEPPTAAAAGAVGGALEEKEMNNEKANNNELLEALLDAAIDGSKSLFEALRWTAANALTASLPDDERRELLSRMAVESSKNSEKDTDDVLVEDEAYSTTSTASVNEKIAAAVALERRRDAEQWEREKEQILKQAEEAANERVKNELAIQRQRMDLEMIQTAKDKKDEVDRRRRELQDARNNRAEQEQEMDEQAVQNKTSSNVEARYYTPEEYRSLTGREAAKLKALRKAQAEASAREKLLVSPSDTTAVHPILGPVVADLGYKRLHLVSSGKLGTIPIWEKQRTYRHSRAKSMASDKTKSLHLGFPGVICLYEDVDGKLSIIDGQHRVGMMMVLKERLDKRNEKKKRGAKASSSSSTLSKDDDNDEAQLVDFDHILVEVYSQQQQHPQQNGVSQSDDHDHAQEIFTEINKAEPIKLVDMPGVSTAKDRSIITGAVELLQSQYPDMFSPSQRCRVPNVNVDNLRNALFGANVLRRHGSGGNKWTTSKQLYDWMLEQNAALGDKYENDAEAQGWINDRAWTKASRNGFYLGLESSWLYN